MVITAVMVPVIMVTVEVGGNISVQVGTTPGIMTEKLGNI